MVQHHGVSLSFLLPSPYPSSSPNTHTHTHTHTTITPLATNTTTTTVPAECPNRVPKDGSIILNCQSTRCCNSSSNIEFYQRGTREPTCTAPRAVYQVKFVGTWTRACHPDYYFSSAHWSPPTGISHKPTYELWEACMKNPSPGVAQVSQTGSTRKCGWDNYEIR